mgnify:CR=1 FL=1
MPEAKKDNREDAKEMARKVLESEYAPFGQPSLNVNRQMGVEIGEAMKEIDSSPTTAKERGAQAKAAAKKLGDSGVFGGLGSAEGLEKVRVSPFGAEQESSPDIDAGFAEGFTQRLKEMSAQGDVEAATVLDDYETVQRGPLQEQEAWYDKEMYPLGRYPTLEQMSENAIDLDVPVEVPYREGLAPEVVEAQEVDMPPIHISDPEFVPMGQGSQQVPVTPPAPVEPVTTPPASPVAPPAAPLTEDQKLARRVIGERVAEAGVLPEVPTPPPPMEQGVAARAADVEAGIAEGVAAANDAVDVEKNLEADYQKASKSYEEALNERGGFQVDNDRWWHNRSTGQKLLALFSIALQGYQMGLAGESGTPPTLTMIRELIDKDIQQQIDAEERGVKSKETLFGLARMKWGDSQTAKMQAVDTAIKSLQMKGLQFSNSTMQEKFNLEQQRIKSGIKNQNRQVNLAEAQHKLNKKKHTWQVSKDIFAMSAPKKLSEFELKSQINLIIPDKQGNMLQKRRKPVRIFDPKARAEISALGETLEGLHQQVPDIKKWLNDLHIFSKASNQLGYEQTYQKLKTAIPLIRSLMMKPIFIGSLSDYENRIMKGILPDADVSDILANWMDNRTTVGTAFDTLYDIQMDKYVSKLRILNSKGSGIGEIPYRRKLVPGKGGGDF